MGLKIEAVRNSKIQVFNDSVPEKTTKMYSHNT